MTKCRQMLFKVLEYPGGGAWYYELYNADDKKLVCAYQNFIISRYAAMYEAIRHILSIEKSIHPA